MKRLNGMDAMLLYSETPNLHTHTLKVAILDPSDFDGEFDFEAFRHHVRRRLHLLEPLRYQLVDIPWQLHHPMWQEDCDVDLDYHLRRVQVPAPGGRSELDEVIGRVASTPLDRSRPLWEFHFAEGLTGGRYALIGKVHHALADGVASVNLLARAMDLEGMAQDERDHARQIAELPRLLMDAAVGMSRVRRRSKQRGDHPDLADAFDAPSTFLNHVVSPQRRFASTTVPLAEVKATAKALGVTVNDMVLAIATGGLRTLLLDYDGQAQRPIIASVPTATDKSGRVTGNEISGLMISLPVHIADPAERARLVSLATRIAKEDHEIMGPELYGRLMAYLPTAFAPAAFGWLGRHDVPNKLMNVAVSSVIGPRERGHFGGATVTEIYSTGVLSPGAPVNITVWSYVDGLGIAVLTDDQTFKDPHEATDAMTKAFAELRSAAGIPAQSTSGGENGIQR
ncbi:WS/DGAT/MGAT family O-acyltransferase [Mycobacterium montefiorense]|uniref:Diacylglycerol O-acyltransferase n=1 Tax=Mycobacterium montefiorense TaxID=154654 RepID=A0AA37PQZ8_9MYCO|nr:wax ester/triacylglycerol synthase family O-acyltransferase [Mycobacterium montefiorense]GBG36278.1 diacylglycerol O-acyltransferase [Mycobacterium montefiorense]GKU32953.1 diacylglycerol O-acyltransferase [Mycobacterium montefiorense]GKU38577.1 diacylglycerol O-acyltransferase [Mycobacterium montefiorense]GKU46656.1 diacylglycerol O-acyltransferase [Mycobacterium montefiorense]GKU51571.1 diacylglycerol O-acyltransferase [Mycobacterium montefiorense]